MIRLHSRILWLFVLVAHACAAAAWAWAMPRGFGLGHPRTWANMGVPAGVGVACVVAVIAARAGWRGAARAVLLALAAGYAAAAVVGVAVFPTSGLLPAGVALCAAGVAMLASREPSLRTRGPAEPRVDSIDERDARRPRRTTALAVIVGIITGAALPFTQRAPGPTTHPAGTAPVVAATTPRPATAPSARGVVRLGRGLNVHPGDGSADVARGRLILSIHPLLTFADRSPDRCWTALAPKAVRAGPPRLLTSSTRNGDAIALAYADDASHDLTYALAGDGAVSIVSRTALPRDVYSHLNAFCELHLAGHRRLSVSFSPCPGAWFDVTPQDVAPAQFAYVDAGGTFHVARARRGEKGPFHDLATGRLARGDPLTITFADAGRPALAVTLRDWSRQVSTAPSPTAGWGVPQNGIEFFLNGPTDGSAASLFVTLAATSVGRGWDSVGHAAGTYESRVEIRAVGPTGGEDW